MKNKKIKLKKRSHRNKKVNTEIISMRKELDKLLNEMDSQVKMIEEIFNLKI